MTTNSVYLMKNMANGYYKIGSSRQPTGRERTLQAQEPDIRLVASIQGGEPISRANSTDVTPQNGCGASGLRWIMAICSRLLRSFGADLESIDPASETLEGDTWIATVHKYSPERISTRVKRLRPRKWLFEMPYAVHRSDIEDEVTTQAFGCDVPSDVSNFLERCVPNVRLEAYTIGGMS